MVAAFLPSVLFLPPSLKPLFGHFNLSPLKIRGCFATPRLISALDPSLLPPSLLPPLLLLIICNLVSHPAYKTEMALQHFHSSPLTFFPLSLVQFGSRNSSQNPNGMKIISFPPRGVGLVGRAECIRKFPEKKRIGGGAFCMHDLLVTFALTS